jgi:hypothetical protein
MGWIHRHTERKESLWTVIRTATRNSMLAHGFSGSAYHTITCMSDYRRGFGLMTTVWLLRHRARLHFTVHYYPHPEGPAAGHLDTGFFFVFLSLYANIKMALKFQVTSACSPTETSRLKFVKIKSLFCHSHQIIQFDTNSENQNPAAPFSSQCF